MKIPESDLITEDTWRGKKTRLTDGAALRYISEYRLHITPEERTKRVFVKETWENQAVGDDLNTVIYEVMLKVTDKKGDPPLRKK